MLDAAVSQQRTKNYLTQIKWAVVCKGGAMLASFLAIPLMIRYLGQEQFGVWSTLLTVMSWIVFFDLGLGNGLRNKVAEALSKNQAVLAAAYIGSGYSLIAVLAILVWSIVIGMSFFVSWQSIFNTTVISEPTLRMTVNIAVTFIVLNFWMGLINALLGAVQRTSLIAFGQLISNGLALLLVYLISMSEISTIVNLALIYGGTVTVSNVLLSFWFYRAFPTLRPRLKMDRQHVRPLLSVGIQFFVIQLAVLLIFTTDKILITQLFGPAYVAQYEVVFKLMSIFTFAHSMVTTPLWSAYTDAYHRGDLAWIRKILNKQLVIFGAMVVGVVILAMLARPLIRIWVGPGIVIERGLVPSMAILVLVTIWSNIYAYFLNGVQKIQLSWIVAVAAMCINIPLSILLAKYTTLGISSVVIGTSCALLLPSFFGCVQTFKIVGGQADGIWGR
ncbi:lipopolysaccharide biosynthesis protein [Janthinobacterium sp. LB3P112]|uniref:lipopolysaccharide biosynthesis protein n=1 Tax=Janthinobacterium sp. LB3P112 TaxID=3424196 RepID=UPI003F1EAB40